MGQADASEQLKLALEQIKSQAASERIRITQHAAQEMTEEGVTLNEVLQAVQTAEILEHYPEHKRGACCLLNGRTQQGRWLHLVCTTAQTVVVVITVYEPKPPKWVTPTQRGKKS